MNNSNDTNKLLTKLYTKKPNSSKSKLKKGANKSHNNSSSTTLSTPTTSTINFASSVGQHQHYHQQQQTSTATTMPSASSISSSSTVPSNKDKSHHHKAYTAINKSSIKCIWEQHNKSEIELHADVYPKLTEDVTYKLWELANNLKTYTRHSGGRLNSDLVNEVLKDSDVAPAIGAGNTSWDHVDYDGTYFFHFDEILELGDEYRKDVNLVQCGPLHLQTTWLLTKDCADDLNAFYRALCAAIFIGNDYTFDYAIQTSMVSQYIGCVIKPIIIKCLEMLVLEYTDDTLERVIKFLTAIVYNYYARDSSMNDQLFHLCQLLVCLVLGPLDLNTCTTILLDDNYDDNNIIIQQFTNQHYQQQPYTFNDEHQQYSNMSNEMVEKFKMEEKINCISEELQNLEQKPSILSSSSSISSTIVETPTTIRTLSKPRTTNIYSTLNVENIRNQDYEDLFQVMENEGFSGKTELTDEADFEGFKIKQEIFEPKDFKDDIIKMEVKIEEPLTQDDYRIDMNNVTKYVKEEMGTRSYENCNGFMSNGVNFDATNNTTFNNDGETSNEYSSITTVMCADRYVDDLCFMIGSAADSWGYFESEIIFLLSQRLKVFFRTITEWTKTEYNWLSRIIRLLVALGDYAVRELTVYFHKIDVQYIPEWMFCNFNQMGVFLRGRSDIFFYEYLYEVCGDGLQPFLIHYTKYLEKFAIKDQARCSTAKKFAIKTKYKIISQSKKQQFKLENDPRHSIAEMFPNYQKFIPTQKRKICLKFSGGRPVILKSKIKCNGIMQKENDTLTLFNNIDNVVVAKRKLLKTLTDERKPNELYNFKCFVL